MSILETIRVALASIVANLLRSVLTMLGIIIGVAAVITIIALGEGAQEAIDDQINALGGNLVSVMAGQSFFRGVASANRTSLTADDAEALERDGRVFSAIVPEISAGRSVKYRNRNVYASVIGTTANYGDVNVLTIAHGRAFTDGDNAARRRVAVLGASVPTSLNEEPIFLIGKMLSIGGIPFEIIGIYASRGASMGFGPNPDEDMYIPIETARHRALGSDRLRSISVQIADGTPLEAGMVDIERVLRREHKIRPGADNDFMIMNRQQILSARQAATETFSFLLAGIAAVSLVVGGIGIMNIMLVSVTERTREIGVRKALGATRGNIMAQFVVEALTIGLLGGSIGIALGITAAYFGAGAAGWQVHVSPNAIGLAVSFSLGVGLVFGIWPARRAATLDPIEALRHD